MNNARSNSNEIRVPIQGKFIISLESNPTTGYVWEARFDTEFIQLIKRKFHPSQGIGAGGIETFEFQASKCGEIGIKMLYKRPWTKDESAIEKKIFQVKIYSKR